MKKIRHENTSSAEFCVKKKSLITRIAPQEIYMTSLTSPPNTSLVFRTNTYKIPTIAEPDEYYKIDLCLCSSTYNCTPNLKLLSDDLLTRVCKPIY